MNHDVQIDSLKQQILGRYAPRKHLLFGSCAKGVYRKKSDIDLCVVVTMKDYLMKNNPQLVDCGRPQPDKTVQILCTASYRIQCILERCRLC